MCVKREHVCEKEKQRIDGLIGCPREVLEESEDWDDEFAERYSTVRGGAEGAGSVCLNGQTSEDQISGVSTRVQTKTSCICRSIELCKIYLWQLSSGLAQVW